MGTCLEVIPRLCGEDPANTMDPITVSYSVWILTTRFSNGMYFQYDFRVLSINTYIPNLKKKSFNNVFCLCYFVSG